MRTQTVQPKRQKNNKKPVTIALEGNSGTSMRASNRLQEYFSPAHGVAIKKRKK